MFAIRIFRFIRQKVPICQILNLRAVSLDFSLQKFMFVFQLDKPTDIDHQARHRVTKLALHIDKIGNCMINIICVQKYIYIYIYIYNYIIYYIHNKSITKTGHMSTFLF